MPKACREWSELGGGRDGTVHPDAAWHLADEESVLGREGCPACLSVGSRKNHQGCLCLGRGTRLLTDPQGGESLQGGETVEGQDKYFKNLKKSSKLNEKDKPTGQKVIKLQEG